MLSARNLETEGSVFKAIAEYVPLSRELLAGVPSSLDLVAFLHDAVRMSAFNWLAIV